MAFFILYLLLNCLINVILVDPYNTNQECLECGFIDKANRITRDNFKCKKCGYVDYVVPVNISRRAVVNQPNVGA